MWNIEVSEGWVHQFMAPFQPGGVGKNLLTVENKSSVLFSHHKNKGLLPHSYKAPGFTVSSWSRPTIFILFITVIKLLQVLATQQFVSVTVSCTAHLSHCCSSHLLTQSRVCSGAWWWDWLYPTCQLSPCLLTDPSLHAWVQLLI